MKLIDFALILVIVLMPLTLVNLIDTNAKIKGQNIENLYNNIIDTALINATQEMKTLEHEDEIETDYGYNATENKKININAKYGVDRFLETLYDNFDVRGNAAKEDAIKQYIPAIAVIDYDGVYIYAVDDYTQNGIKQTGSILKPKKFYTYKNYNTQNGKTYILNFTLSDYITIQCINDGSIVRGYINEIDQSGISNISNIKEFKSRVIIDIITSEITYAINKHNEYSKLHGILYNFYMPEISTQDWRNSIEDAGMFAFVQGIAVGNKYLNHFAFGVSNTAENIYYELTIGIRGRIYHRDNVCKYIDSDNKTLAQINNSYNEDTDNIHGSGNAGVGASTSDNESKKIYVDGKTFARSRLEAARAGFEPCPLCNP